MIFHTSVGDLTEVSSRIPVVPYVIVRLWVQCNIECPRPVSKQISPVLILSDLFLRSILIIFFHLLRGLPCGLFVSLTYKNKEIKERKGRHMGWKSDRKKFGNGGRGRVKC